MKFSKWQGCGNDFVLIDGREADIDDFPRLARRLTDRHYGVGGDGILVVLPSEKADFRMRIFNSDGSEAEMCGNGIRCFARFLYESGATDKKEFTVETGAGVLTPKLIFEGDKVSLVRVDMGEPHLNGEEIPVVGFDGRRVINAPIKVAAQDYRMTCVSMGNPHCVVFVEDLRQSRYEILGSSFETHELFPKNTNAEFVEVIDREHLKMGVWERGTGLTLACGTGACAVLVAAVLNDKSEREAEIELPGGKLRIEWAADNHVYMTGPAEQVFTGELTT